MELTLLENTDDGRFEVRDPEGQVAGFIDYLRAAQSMILVHTEVSEQFKGQGVGSRLVRATLDALQDEGITVVNECPFIQQFLARHPGEYDWVQ